MKHSRSLAVLAVGSAAFLVLPIILTSYVGSNRASIELPVIHYPEPLPEWAVTPISDRKAQAVHDFKTAQV